MRFSYFEVDTDPFRPDAKRGSMRRLTAGGREVFDNQKSFLLHCCLPYGKWTCEDGREVLFNRHYEPIWESRPGEPSRQAYPKERVPCVKQEYFWPSDRESPWRKRETLDECIKVLCEFTGNNGGYVSIDDLKARLQPLLRYADIRRSASKVFARWDARRRPIARPPTRTGSAP
jgi:hypothetical protein